MPMIAGRSPGSFDKRCMSACTPPAEAPTTMTSRAWPSALIIIAMSPTGGEIDGALFLEDRAEPPHVVARLRDALVVRPADLIASMTAGIGFEVVQQRDQLLERAHGRPHVGLDLVFLPREKLVGRHRVLDATDEAEIAMSFADDTEHARALGARDARHSRPAGLGQIGW